MLSPPTTQCTAQTRSCLRANNLSRPENGRAWASPRRCSPASPWRVTVRGAVAQPLELSLADLQEFPQVDRTVDIHCVTRWSRLGVRFQGVPLAAILAAASPLPTARFVSFIAYSARNHSTSLPLADAIALDTLIAWQCDGQPLESSHGGPVRIIVPGRYFYKSLKWLRAIELLTDDSLGYWEREAGYHNTGDPCAQTAYMAPNLTRQQIQTALRAETSQASICFGLDARLHDLTGLNAQGSLLRNADFRQCRLVDANFTQANLSNAHLGGAILSVRDLSRPTSKEPTSVPPTCAVLTLQAPRSWARASSRPILPSRRSRPR